MKLEQQVTSLELSKRLKELGVKQESYFSYYWFSQKKHMSNEWYEPKLVLHSEAEIDDDNSWEERYERIWSAFTVAELGELLTENYMTGKLFGFKKWAIWSHNSSLPEGMPLEFTYADTQADCMAKMLIYLIENKLITL